MEQTILSVVIGAILALLITIGIENARKPKLEIQVGDPKDNEYIDRPAKRARFLYLTLVNRALPAPLQWMSRNTALQCHGTISFYHMDKQNVFGREMPIRWSDTFEPVGSRILIDQLPGVAIDSEKGSIRPVMYHGIQGIIIDPAKFLPISRIDVCTGESERFDIAARFDEENECYGWSNENYFSDPIWRNPNWCLPHGRYLVMVTIISGGEKVSKIFRLINDVPLNSFRLENAHTEDNF